MIHPSGQAQRILTAQGVGGRADDRDAATEAPQGFGQFVAVEAGHVDVGQDDVERSVGPQRQSLFAIAGQRYGAAQFFELIAQDQLIDDVVFGHQDVQA